MTVNLLPEQVANRQVTNWEAKTIKERIERGNLDDSPVYQRSFIKEFDLKFKNRLIESILCDCPIPGLYFCATGKNQWDVLDGQQRVKTIVGFMKGDWELNTSHFDKEKWSDTAIKAMNKAKFADLDNDLQLVIESYSFGIEIFEETEEWPARDIYRRINAGGSNLNAMELHKSRYAHHDNWGKLFSFADSTEWTSFVGQKNSRLNALEMLIYHHVWADAAHTGGWASADYGSNKSKQVALYLKHMMSDDYDMSKAIERTKKWMRWCIDLYGDKPFSVKNFKLSDRTENPGGKVTKPVVKTFFSLFSSVVPRIIQAYDGTKVIAASSQIREDFMYFVNDDVTLMGGKTPYFHYVEGRQQQYPTQIRRAEWYWGRVQAILEEFVIIKDPKRCFPQQVFDDLWAVEANRTCGFCKTSINAKSAGVVDHITHWVDGGPTDMSNARLAHRYCNWVDGQHKARQRKEAKQKSSQGGN
jgi:hypothetical protein